MREDAGRSQAAVARRRDLAGLPLADRGGQCRAEPRGAHRRRGGARLRPLGAHVPGHRPADPRSDPGRDERGAARVAAPAMARPTGGARLPAGPRRDRPRADGRDGARRRADGAAEPSCGASSSRSAGPCRRRTRWRRSRSLPATASAACWSCETRLRCARPSEPPPGRSAAAYPARAADAIAALTARRPWPGAALLWANVERGEARILDGPPRGSPSGDSIVVR